MSEFNNTHALDVVINDPTFIIALGKNGPIGETALKVTDIIEILNQPIDVCAIIEGDLMELTLSNIQTIANEHAYTDIEEYDPVASNTESIADINKKLTDENIDGIGEKVTKQGEQLQNCFEKPHQSLEYALFVENGELKEWSKDGESKLHTSEQVGNGDLDTRSLSGKGLNGIIGEDNLHIGKGYKNYWNDSATLKDLRPSFTLDKNGKNPIYTVNSDDTYHYHRTRSEKSSSNSMFAYAKIKVKALNPLNNIYVGIHAFGTTFTKNYETPNEKVTKVEKNGWIYFTYERKKSTTTNSFFMGIGVGSEAPVNSKYELGYVITVKSETPISNLPYIRDSIPDGRCVLGVDWTSEDHSFIGVVKTDSSDSYAHLYACASSAYEGVRGSQVIKDKKLYFLISKTYKKIIDSEGTEYNATLYNAGKTSGAFNILRKSPLYSSNSASDISELFSYKADLTEEQLKSEFTKIKNKKLNLDSMGFVENIPNSKKRMDKSGILKTHLNITSAEKDEDIYMAVEGDMYEIIDSPIPTYVTIGADGNIPVGSKIKNVAGYIRSNEANVVYPFKMRGVK